MNDIYNLLLEKLDYLSLKLSETTLNSKSDKTGTPLDNMPE